MKFVHYLEKISGVSIFPLFSLLLFLAFFLVVTLYVYRTPKKNFERKAGLPLEQ